VLKDALGDADQPALAQLTSDPGFMPAPAPVGSADTSAAQRSSVRQAADLVQIQEGLLGIARSQRLPSINLTSQYGRVAYPQSGVPKWSDFLSNWTVGVGLQVPIFTGFRIRGDEVVAQSNLNEAKARLQQTVEYASLDSRVALAGLEEAQAAWQASVGTAGQAAKAYSIAELRYKEGISTQIELSESRILMQSAMANRALAARNLAVARVRLAVLRDLPLTPGGAQSAMDAGAASAQQQLQQYQQQQQQQQQQASQTSGTGGGLQ
jgi:outer membrane protein